ncbi:MAG: hydrogenase small subunit [Desulfovibrio sp.]|jgi:[NiFe] hydrogenase small subunit|nr:hydrogenase small subunit [Desulfovibrio sp.]
MQTTTAPARDDLDERLAAHGLNRRDFLKYCAAVAAAMGMGPAFAPEVARAVTGGSGRRPTVVYLHNAECTGCSEAILRASDPYIDVLLMDAVNMVYQETIMAAAGEAAEKALHDAVNSPDGFIAIVEGAVPTAENGAWGKVGNHTMLETSRTVLTKAQAVIAYGTCAAYGGIQAAAPNPCGAKGVNDCFGAEGVTAVNVPGCPPNPINIVGTIVYYLKNGKIPELDERGRPLMFFDKSVHELCERREHFENGRFAQSFDSEEARQGWCLYNLGCKGPSTYNNCPKVLFNGVNWPVGAGHPCIGCSEPDFWDKMTPFYHV